jgi:hypothetical protein
MLKIVEDLRMPKSLEEAMKVSLEAVRVQIEVVRVLIVVVRAPI